MHINNAATDKAVILHQQGPKMGLMTFTAEEESMRGNNLLVFQGLVFLMATRKGSLWEGRSLSMSKQPLAESLIPESGGLLRPQRTYRQNPIHLRQRRVSNRSTSTYNKTASLVMTRITKMHDTNKLINMINNSVIDFKKEKIKCKCLHNICIS